MELARRYLEDLQDMLCDEIAHDWEHDARFTTKEKCNNIIVALLKLWD